MASVPCNIDGNAALFQYVFQIKSITAGIMRESLFAASILCSLAVLIIVYLTPKYEYVMLVVKVMSSIYSG